MTITVIIPSIGRPTFEAAVHAAEDADQVVAFVNTEKQLVDNTTDAMAQATGDVIVYLNDRQILRPHWRTKLEARINDGFGVVSFTDILCAGAAVTRDFLETHQQGYLFWPEYIHYHCDQELGMRAERAGTFATLADMMTVVPKPEQDIGAIRNAKCVPWDWQLFHTRELMGFPNKFTIDWEERKNYL